MGDKPFFLSFNICLTPISLYTLEDYQRWFNDPGLPVSHRPGIPKTERGIQAWLFKMMKNRSHKYFSILIGGKNIGHIGLKNIDQTRKSGDLDLFLVKTSSQDWVMLEEIFSWLKFFARTSLNLRKLYVQIDQNGNEILKRLFPPAGFVEDGGKGGLAFWVDL